jgi:hypothetical protein
MTSTKKRGTTAKAENAAYAPLSGLDVPGRGSAMPIVAVTFVSVSCVENLPTGELDHRQIH